MPSVNEIAKPAKSEHRKQQNRQAQKNYRERQLRRLRALESVVESRDIVAELSVAAEDQRPPCEEPDSQSLSATGRGLLLQLLRKHNVSDKDLRQNVMNGSLTIGDVLKAGLQVLSQSCTKAPLTPSSQTALPEPGPMLRTDRIYLLENRFREHADWLPDLRSNNITIKQLSSVAAIRCNAEMLGITFAQMITGSSTSPIHDPLFESGHASAICDTRWKHVSADMRPTQAQIRYPHHPWIDTLPSPTLRQRLIECLSADPPLVAHHDFCEDLEKDGLVCWGSTLAGTNVASGSGAPWDVRSWEAQPWFLRKWWFIIGGEEGELFQSSLWWNQMRGDRLRYAWK